MSETEDFRDEPTLEVQEHHYDATAEIREEHGTLDIEEKVEIADDLDKHWTARIVIPAEYAVVLAVVGGLLVVLGLGLIEPQLALIAGGLLIMGFAFFAVER